MNKQSNETTERTAKRHAIGKDKIGQNDMSIYQISVQGQLDQQWSLWFEGLTVSVGEDDETVLTGVVADQAALHGLLRKIRDLGMPLLAVTRIEPKSNDDTDRTA